MSTRLEPLDSLRGLAALTVLSLHVLLLMPDQGGWLWRAPFYNGHEAVLLFFVLSGFVLYLPWAKGRPPGAWAVATAPRRNPDRSGPGPPAGHGNASEYPHERRPGTHRR